MSFNLIEAELFLRSSLPAKKGIFWSRLAWCLCFFSLLRFAGDVQSGDILLLMFLQLAFFMILLLPDEYIKSYSLRWTYMVADFVFFLWGIGISQIRDLAGILFLIVFYLSCFFARNLRTLVGCSVLYLLFLLALGQRNWLGLAPFLKNESAILWILAAYLISLAVYMTCLGLPINPNLSTMEKLRNAGQSKRTILQAVGRIQSSRSLREILLECRNYILEVLPGSDVEILMISSDRVYPVDTESAATSDSYSLDGQQALKQAIGSSDPVITRFRPEENPALAIGRSSTEPILEILVSFFAETGFDRTYCARIIRTGQELREDEREQIQVFRESAYPAIRRALSEDQALADKKETSARLQALAAENADLHVSADLLSRLLQANTLSECLTGVYTNLQRVIGLDCALLFLVDAGRSRLELADMVACYSLPFSRGFSFAMPDTMASNAIQKNTILLKTALKSPEGEGVPADLGHYLRGDIRALFFVPLSSPDTPGPYGVILLGSRNPTQFKIEQMAILDRIQASLGKGLARFREEQETEQKLREAAAVLQLGEIFSATTGLDSSAQEIGRVLRQSLNLDSCRIFVYDSTTDELRPAGDDSQPEGTPAPAISAQSAGVLGHVCRTRQGYLITNSLSDAQFRDEDSPATSRMVTPIICHDELVGVIEASIQKEDMLRERDLAILNSLAAHIGQVLAGARIREKAESLTQVDPLTGLYNFGSFMEQLKREFAQHTRLKQPMTLLLVKLKDMEKINLEQGYATGDRLLRLLSGVLSSSARSTDTPARLGGATFGLILPNSTAETAVPLVQRLQQSLREQKLVPGLQPLVVASVASFPLHGMTLPPFLRQAELALARAQDNPRTGYSFPEVEIHPFQGQAQEINTAALYREILGPSGTPGPHTTDPLNAVIERLLALGADEAPLTDIFSRLIWWLDQPDGTLQNIHLVPDLARRIGEELKIGEQKIRLLVLAARIYDIGKFSIPSEILYAPRILDETEHEAVVNHVKVAQDILRLHRIFTPLLPIIKFHHERWDGSGYPWRLNGEEIPMESHILGITDVFKALVCDRPYRGRLSLPEAIQVIAKTRGQQFDPKLVDTTLRVLQNLKKS